VASVSTTIGLILSHYVLPLCQYCLIYSTCASGTPILNLLVDNREIARSLPSLHTTHTFHTEPCTPCGSVMRERMNGSQAIIFTTRIYESNYQLSFCHAEHSLHILSENYVLVPTSLRRALNANCGAKHTGRSRRTNADYPETQPITHNSAWNSPKIPIYL